jgi:hypothetical protein
LEATQSLLTASSDGNTFLAVKQTGEHVWDLCAIDVRRGEVKWCSRLAQRADIALSVAADKAIVNAASGDITAYDLANGQLVWRSRLDCEIRPGRLRVVEKGLALAECYREGITASEPGKPKLMGIDLKDGKLRWQYAAGGRHTGHYLLDGYLLHSLGIGLSAQDPAARPLRRPLDRRHARGYHHFAGLYAGPSPPKTSTRVGDQDSGWRILDLETGLALPASALARKTDGTLGGDNAPAVAPAVFSDGAAIFDREVDGLRARPERWSCGTRMHDPWLWMLPAGLIWRASRLFSPGCDEVFEIDPATTAVRWSWPMAKDGSLPDPLLIALVVAGSRVTFVLGSRDDRETGRIVTFDGPTLVLASRSPALDPDLIALTSDVLVVQEQVHLGLLEDGPPPSASRKPVLAGYSLTDVRPEPLDGDRSSTERIRGLIAPLGIPDQNLCSACETMLDAKSRATLQAIPRWEMLLSALLLDRSRRTREAAVAAVKQLHTPALLQALVGLLDPKPTPGWSPWNREPGWWMLVAEKEHEARLQAAMALIELRHLPAIKPLTKLLLAAPVGDHHDPLGGMEFPRAFCLWVASSDLPETKQAVAEYDRAMNALGAWQARCDALTREPSPRPRGRARN